MTTALKVMDGDSARRVRDSMEGWREAVLAVDAFLGWKQEWHPAAIAGTITAVFLTIWYTDPSLLTLLATIGLFLTLADFIGPKILDRIFKPESWTNEKEKNLEKVCHSVVSLGHLLSSLSYSLGTMKATSPMLHFSLVCSALLTLAWLGTFLSGLFLLYVTILFIVMLPGLHRRGLLEKHCGAAMAKLKETIKGKKVE